MKQILLLILLTISAYTVHAQPIYASTEPENKTVILEEFTGVKCGVCPSGHQTVNALLELYPDKIIPLAYSPENSTLTTPYPGDENLQRTYLNAFYSIPFLGKRFMPGGVINRRVWSNGNRLQTTDYWKFQTKTIRNEPSPVNVGLHSTYDPATNLLTVTVELYFTANTGDLKLYVHLLEDNIQVQQAGTNVSPYTLYHVFREHLNTAQWGDPVSGPTTEGTVFSTQYLFNLNDPNVDLNNVQIVAFVNDVDSEENLSGKMIPAITPVSNHSVSTLPHAKIFPNPVTEDMYVSFTANTNLSVITIYNLLGQKVFSKPIQGKGLHQLAFAKKGLNVKRGLYLVLITSGNQTFTSKLVFE